MKRWQIVLIFMFVVIGLAGYGLLLHFMPYRLETELAEARRQGIPTSAAEVRLPVIPPGQDAAPLYERALAIQKKNDFTEREWKLMENLRTSGISDSEAAELRRAFDAHSDYLSALHSGAAKPHLALPRNAFNPLSPPFGMNSRLRRAAMSVQSEARLLLREGRPLAAVRVQSLGYRIAAQIYEQPMVLSMLVAMAVEGITETGLRDILKKSPPNAAVSEAVMDAAGRNLEEPDLRNAMSTGVVATGELIKMPHPFGDNSVSLLNRVKEKSKVAVDFHWEARLIRASEGTPAVRRTALKAVADEYSRAKYRGVIYEYSDARVPLGPDLEDCCASAAAGRRVVYAAAAVMRYRALHGRFPASLSDAVKRVPLDPIGICPLEYRRTSKGFEIRAVQTNARVPSKGLEFEYP